MHACLGGETCAHGFFEFSGGVGEFGALGIQRRAGLLQLLGGGIGRTSGCGHRCRARRRRCRLNLLGGAGQPGAQLFEFCFGVGGGCFGPGALLAGFFGAL